MPLSIADLHRIVGGQLRLGEMPPRDGDCSAIGPIVTDSRAVRAGDVFWGLKGTAHDGSHFADEALARGACGVVTSGRWVAPWAGRWTIEVEDSAHALWQLAAWNCDRFTGRLITVEGALGKTVTAAMTAAVLNIRLIGETVIGRAGGHSPTETAAALVGLPAHHDYALVELCSGTSQGQPMGKLSNADIAVFVHSGHCAAASSNAAVDSAVLDRLDAVVRKGGPIIVNGDDAYLRRVAQGADNVIFVGRGAEAHVVADRIESANGRLRFSVAGHRYCVAAWGRHQLTAALTAIAVGRLCGVTDTDIVAGLASFEPADRCSQTFHAGDVTIIDDTAHNRPAATLAAMDVLGEFSSQGRRFLLFGGEPASEQDLEFPGALGEHAVTRAGADLLVASGGSADRIVASANRAGMRRNSSIVCQSPDEAAREVLARLQPGDTVLVSGRPMAAIKQRIEQYQATTLRRAA